nr:MAG TPA: hypothetical protein [Caudoviricetes sp.]
MPWDFRPSYRIYSRVKSFYETIYSLRKDSCVCLNY